MIEFNCYPTFAGVRQSIHISDQLCGELRNSSCMELNGSGLLISSAWLYWNLDLSFWKMHDLWNLCMVCTTHNLVVNLAWRVVWFIFLLPPHSYTLKSYNPVEPFDSFWVSHTIKNTKLPSLLSWTEHVVSCVQPNLVLWGGVCNVITKWSRISPRQQCIAIRTELMTWTTNTIQGHKTEPGMSGCNWKELNTEPYMHTFSLNWARHILCSIGNFDASF